MGAKNEKVLKGLMLRGRAFERRIRGGYFQDRDGKWWLLNPQRGWVRVDASGRAFRQCLAEHTRRGLRDARAEGALP